MKNLAPQILRKRLLIEARYESRVTAEGIKEYLLGMARALKLRTYGEPRIQRALNRSAM